MTGPIQSTEALVLQEQMRGVTSGISELKTAMNDVNKTLVKLVQVEERQLEHSRSIERAFRAIESTDARVDKIEIEMPPLKATRVWTIGAIVVIVLLAIGSILINSGISIKAPIAHAEQAQ